MKKNNHNLLKAILFILFGVLILINPGKALLLIAMYFGILAIAGGIISFYAAWRFYRRNRYTGPGIIEGIISTSIGLIILGYPEVTVSLFMVFFCIWAFLIGIVQIYTYRTFSELNIQSGSLLVSGILSVIVALVLLFEPFTSAGIIAVIIAIYAIIYGVSLFLINYK